MEEFLKNPSAIDYHVVSYSKLCLKNNNSPRNDSEICSLAHLWKRVMVMGATHVAMPPTKVKFAFTLAEVLITLGIIGIVAAMTIPTLSQKLYEKRTVTQLRAVQSILAQAIKAAEAEDGEVEGWGLKQDHSKEDAELIAEKLLKHMKVAHDCGTEPDTNGFCFPNITYTYLNGNKTPNYASQDNYYKIILNNGASIFMQSYADNTDNDEGYINFNVDINGPKPPNTVGKDLFDFNYSKGSVRPNGAPGSAGDGNCDKGKSGWGCAYYVLQTGKLLK